MMNIKPIRTQDDYHAALAEIDRLFEAPTGTPEGDVLDVLVTLVEAYEAEHYPISIPDPIEAIKYHMERLDLKHRDLEPYIGSRTRVWEILNKKRRLTLSMIRNLNKAFGIPAEVLIREYPVDQAENDEAGGEEEVAYGKLDEWKIQYLLAQRDFILGDKLFASIESNNVSPIPGCSQFDEIQFEGIKELDLRISYICGTELTQLTGQKLDQSKIEILEPV